MRNRRSAGLLAGTAAMAMALTACADDGGDDPGDNGGDGGALAGETISIGVFSGWDEGIVASFLMGNLFESEGATVEYTFAEPGPTFAGVAQGSADIAFDAWLPNTHADYWEEFSDTVEDLGAWYDEAPLTIAVNADAPIQSLEELAENADTMNNRIVGIEPGAGLTRITREQVIPTYGLEDMEFIESSSNAMLQELDTALNAGDNIVVTLWRPHWAYAAYDIRDLEDPENALGDPERIHSFARPGFSEENPQVVEWVSNFNLTAEQLIEIEEIMVVQNEASSNEEYAASIQEWLDANPDFLSQVKGE